MKKKVRRTFIPNMKLSNYSYLAFILVLIAKNNYSLQFFLFRFRVQA